jgi:hypothetical protein
MFFPVAPARICTYLTDTRSHLGVNVMSDEQEDEKNRRLAEDGSTFGLDDALGTGDATAEVTTTSSNKLLLIGIFAGGIAIVLVACITAGFIGVAMSKRAAEQGVDGAKNPQFVPAQELKGKIKIIDRDAMTMRFLMSNNTHKTFQVSDKTEFFDREGTQMKTGLDDPALREEEYCVFLPTDDQLSLRWLKLTPPPR